MRSTWVRSHSAILLFGLLNATLFCALQPLWEGFDEPFHYGYVETLWQTGRLPVLGRTMLPADVFASFPLAPMSYSVHQFIPQSVIFSDWFALPQAEKVRRRTLLDALRPSPQISERPNYEAHQTPLAYLVMAPLDAAISRAPLRMRVLILRLGVAWAAVVLLFYGIVALCRTLEIARPFAAALLFTAVCCEMFYATSAHVANDGLAVGIGTAFVASLAMLVKTPGRASFLRMAAWLAAGLLAKAYFLAFALLAAGITGVLLWRRHIAVPSIVPGLVLIAVLAGPWYARNVALYGNVAGTHEAFDGIGIRETLAEFPRIDWPAAAGFLARGSLWMGNNSSGSFSRGTLNLMLAVLAVAFAAWCWHWRATRPAERTVLAAILVFSIAVAYASCANVADRHGTVIAAPPWYTQVLLAPVLAIAYLGMMRWKRFGPLLAMVNVALWAWVLLATWIVKLFPLYSGGASSPMRAHDVWNWWMHGAPSHAVDLSLTSLAPAGWLYVGLVVSAALTLILAARVIVALRRSDGGE